MSASLRLWVFIIGAVALATLWATAGQQLPGPVELRDRYLLAINTHVVPERNTTDAITAVNFDYRGIDTLGEEFILFVSVMGTLVLLREAHEKPKTLPDAVSEGRRLPASDALRLWTLVMCAPTFLFGVYMVTHGQLTPGGGFQGGVILASNAVLAYLGLGFETFKKIAAHSVMEVVEAIGVLAFISVGVIGLIKGLPFLTNVLPLGASGELTSSGTIALISAATGLEVAAGFILLLHAFLQSLLTREGEK